MAKTKTSWIRWMLRRDVERAAVIDQVCFDSGWTVEDFCTCLRHPKHISMVVEEGDTIIGYMVYALHKNRIDVLNFAILPEYRGRGHGAALVNKLFYKVTSHNRAKLTVAVRESNTNAQLFFKHMGLRAVGVTPRFYGDTGEDAYHMEWLAPFDSARVTPTLHNRIAQHEES